MAHLPPAVSRRHFLLTSAAVGVGASLAGIRPSLAAAADEKGGVVQQFRAGGATAKIDVVELRGGIRVLIGSGGNIGVLPGKDGKLLVDAGLAGSKPQISDALANMGGGGGNGVAVLVNTHWHFDHTDGNEWMHETGAAIVGHENCRKRLSEPTRVDAWDFTFPPAPEGARPIATIKHDLTLFFNDTRVVIEAYGGPRHTDTDLCVTFPDADVFHAGDTWWNGHYPFIDYSTGGSINGMIQAVEQNLEKIGPKTQVIPGHGPVGDKSSMAEFRDVLAGARDAIAAMKKQGKTLEEVVAAKPTAKHDAKWGDFVINPATFAALVYAGV
jgi:glyoxylase-like metal-dependent hydrolase (beta-lactamase superfamily II)